MGQEISRVEFSEEDFIEFRKYVRNETKVLMDWFRNDRFEPTEGICGLELEAWLVDSANLPLAENERFIDDVNNPLVVPELSRFNFELNNHPRPLKGHHFSQVHQELKTTWDECRVSAAKLGAEILMIGVLPTLRNEMLTLEQMSPLRRYYALNQQILKLRKNNPLELNIKGKDHLITQHGDIMLEAAATSLQIHLQVNSSESTAFYNTAQAISAPMVAAGANSPYLFGKDLWAETRIPTFEQAIALKSFRDKLGLTVGRVTFGTGYAKESLFEVFLENLDGFPPLLPLVTPELSEELRHLRLHNGTIWRWNRPLIGINDKGTPHLRIEHRVASAGPTLTDSIANIAFFVGLSHYFVRNKIDLTQEISFDQAKSNFYKAAQEGLEASVEWRGRQRGLQQLISDELIPAAQNGLEALGVAKDDIRYYLEETLKQRISSGQNGAHWQRSYMAKNGPDFQEMTTAYVENQKSDQPVHTWTV